MNTITIYLVLTTKLAIANFHNRSGSTTPMLNDHLGDRCHQNLADAVAAGLNIAEDLDQQSADIAVVHVTYDRALHEALAFEGHIEGVRERDFFGKPLWTVSAEGARRLNGAASFLMDVYPLPLEVKARACQGSQAIN